MQMLINFNPHILQDNWLEKTGIHLGHKDHTEFVETLIEAREEALGLDVMSRLQIIVYFQTIATSTIFERLHFDHALLISMLLFNE